MSKASTARSQGSAFWQKSSSRAELGPERSVGALQYYSESSTISLPKIPMSSRKKQELIMDLKVVNELEEWRPKNNSLKDCKT